MDCGDRVPGVQAGMEDAVGDAIAGVDDEHCGGTRGPGNVKESGGMRLPLALNSVDATLPLTYERHPFKTIARVSSSMGRSPTFR